MIRSEPPLIVRSLRKEYRVHGGSPLCAVDGISFEIQKGECFGLLGPNGAGKSTSMNCITGFYPATAGQIRLMGYDVFREPDLTSYRRRNGRRRDSPRRALEASFESRRCVPQAHRQTSRERKR